MGSSEKITVWDMPTRVFHVALIIVFALSSYSAFQDKFGLYGDMHLYSGIAMMMLIFWRILWGIFGSETIRFSNFIASPKAVIAYLKNPSSHSYGHNPLGGYSVLLMLVLLLAQASLGLFANDDIFFEGPFARHVANSGELTAIHEILGKVLLGLVGLHILAVAFHAVFFKKNLIWPMISGKAERLTSARAPKIAHPIKALILFLIAAGAVYWRIYLY